MTIRGTLGIFVLVAALLLCSGCVQPDATRGQIPANGSTPGIPVPVAITSTAPDVPATPIPTVVTSAVTTVVAVPAATPVLPAPEPTGFVRYTGPDYSVEYPAAWSANSTLLPLREYRHSWYDCTATFAYNLDQDLRMYSSRDDSIVFYSSVVDSGRDIWPRNVRGDVVYQDIVNSVLGNPESCANLEGNKAFTIGDISRVPLDGVSFPGVRVDFAKINLTGFRDGTGTMYVVTGKNHSGVFTFYSTAGDSGAQAQLSQYMFDSLRLDSAF